MNVLGILCLVQAAAFAGMAYRGKPISDQELAFGYAFLVAWVWSGELLYEKVKKSVASKN